MKYKLTLMFLFSFLVHIAIAGALVYVPYQVSVNNEKSFDREVIWGRIYRGEGRRQKAEGRSTKQEVRSKMLEQAPPILRPLLTPASISGEEVGRNLIASLLLGEGRLGEQTNEDDTKIIPSHLRGEGQDGGEPRTSPPLFKDGREGGLSDEHNINTGNDNNVLFASSIRGKSDSDIDEADDIKNAEKLRIYRDQLNALSDQVKKEIEKNKYYPFLAKLKGIEGTVYVNFLIGQDGKPGNIEIMKSSGSEILDVSAIKTIKNLKPFRNINPELRELDITVPITYRLKEDR